MTGQDTLDLRDISLATVQTPMFSGDASGGTLSVTDGTHSANIALLGNYMAFCRQRRPRRHDRHRSAGSRRRAAAGPPAAYVTFVGASFKPAPTCISNSVSRTSERGLARASEDPGP